jgi:hypothetical protein
MIMKTFPTIRGTRICRAAANAVASCDFAPTSPATEVSILSKRERKGGDGKIGELVVAYRVAILYTMNIHFLKNRCG